MEYMIKELRRMTGLSQSGFASEYKIPLSTLRKWEQGQASPPPYVLDMIAEKIPETVKSMRKIETSIGNFYFDAERHMLVDSIGNEIRIKDDLNEIHEGNLKIYIKELFEEFYRIQEKFNRDCVYDKTEGIIWC